MRAYLIHFDKEAWTFEEMKMVEYSDGVCEQLKHDIVHDITKRYDGTEETDVQLNIGEYRESDKLKKIMEMFYDTTMMRARLNKDSSYMSVHAYAKEDVEVYEEYGILIADYMFIVNDMKHMVKLLKQSGFDSNYTETHLDKHSDYEYAAYVNIYFECKDEVQCNAVFRIEPYINQENREMMGYVLYNDVNEAEDDYEDSTRTGRARYDLRFEQLNEIENTLMKMETNCKGKGLDVFYKYFEEQVNKRNAG